MSEIDSNKEWMALSPFEKATILNYRKKLVNNERIHVDMLLAVNLIHQKHPDFHIGLAPEDKINRDAFNTIPEEDQEILISYKRFKDMNIEDNYILGLSILARKLLEKYPAITLRQISYEQNDKEPA